MENILSRIILSTVLSLVIVSVATAANTDNIPSKKQTKLGLYLTAKDAYELKSEKSNVIFVDVRTRAEIAFIGMPLTSDANIPYMVSGDWGTWDEKKKNYKLEPNSGFLLSMEDLVKAKGANKDSKIILICRSGSRSAKAANLLAQNGYTSVYTVLDGFEGDKAKSGDLKGQRVVNGWKNSHLPWSYKLDKNKMYDL
ncbi:MAG: rhodanese-like domain-containing protein [Candidatus Thiodiazotropha sp. DIVDIV]